MFIKIEEIKIENIQKTRGRRYKSKRIITCSCDECGKEFQTGYSHNELERVKTKFAFCCKECRHKSKIKGGKLCQHIQQKIDYVTMQEKIKKTLIEKYGVTNVSQLPDHILKVQKTLQEHGSYLDNPIKKEKHKQKMIEKYGYEWPMQNKQVLEKQYNTNLERYGNKHVCATKDVQEKSHSIETIQKRHQTMKNRDFNKISKSENKFYQLLLEVFPNTIQQQLIHKWNIDFYVPEIITYIQFDGTYWHGLNRTFEDISKLKYKQDKTILSTIERDKQQNIWFQENNIKLLRFKDTDKQEDIIKILIELKNNNI
jgi:gas vesicle protein